MDKVSESIVNYFNKKGYEITYFTADKEKKPSGTFTIYYVNVASKNIISRNQSQVSYDEALISAYYSIKSDELKVTV